MPREFELRLVDAGYAQQLAELWRTTFRQAYKGVHSEENFHAYFEAKFTVSTAEDALSDSSVVCKMAFRDFKALGFYLIRHHECPVPLTGGSSELKQIYVLADEYGSGVGKLLFDDALQCIREAGGLWVWLIVSDLNKRAQSFYRKLSFKPLGIGPLINIGSDQLSSTIMGRKI